MTVGLLQATPGVRILGLDWGTRLALLRIRLAARAFCWTADHCPRLAEVWALRR